MIDQPSGTSDQPNPEPQQSARLRGTSAPLVLGTAAILTAAMIGAVVWLMLPGGDRARSRGLTTVAGSELSARAPFVGSAACASCHPGEHAGHRASGHARTLHRAGETEIARWLDGRAAADPELPDQSWSYRLTDQQVHAERSESGQIVARHSLDLALGSGAHAVTFVSLIDKPGEALQGLEHRLTYFRHSDALGVTPGQSAARDKPGRSADGFLLPPLFLRDCLECHATPTAPALGEAAELERMLPNVNCERCHGPGRAHVELAQSGIREGRRLALPFGGGETTADAQINMCGRCHRLPEMVPPETIVPENAALARFPSVGLLQSACFRESGNTLSCTTCHNPHARAASAANPYQEACLACHHAGPTGLAADVQVKVCPVNAAEGCVECHMPKLDSGYGIPFTDHWIRKRGAGDDERQPN